MSEIKKDNKGYYKLEKGYRRKLIKCICVMCGAVRFLKPSKARTHCRKCAYTINAFKINNYIKRPGRNSKGQYTKGDEHDQSNLQSNK